MSLYIEEKYIGLVGHSLAHFRKQSKDSYTFRCPFCGDSKKRQNKTRGYFFIHKGYYWFKCHNCNETMSLSEFLKKKFFSLYQEYNMDRIRDREPTKTFFKPLANPVLTTKTYKRQELSIPSIAELSANHIAVKYCKSRLLPENSFTELYFTDKWTDFILHNNMGYTFAEDNCPRLVLPWFTRQGQMLGAQARRIDVTGKEGRYITLKMPNDTGEAKAYGLDRVNLHHPIYIVEGPLDSWFLPNCVAAMGADILRVKTKLLSNYQATLIWDNEPRNLNIVSEINSAISQKFPVVIWPSDIKEKDLNDMVKAGIDVKSVVKDRTFTDLRAQLEFTKWKKW